MGGVAAAQRVTTMEQAAAATGQRLVGAVQLLSGVTAVSPDWQPELKCMKVSSPKCFEGASLAGA